MHEQAHVINEARLPLLKYFVSQGTANVPDFRPDLSRRTPQGLRMFSETEDMKIGVVVEKRHLRAPSDPQWMLRIENEAHRGFEALRPVLGLPEWMGRPVEVPNQPAHL